MKCFKKIIPFFFVFAILVPCLIVPGFAANSDSRQYLSVPFWDVAVRDDWGGAGFWTSSDDYEQFVSDLNADLGSTVLANGAVRLYPTFKDTFISSSSWCTLNSATVRGNTLFLNAMWKSDTIKLELRYDPIVAPFPGHAVGGYDLHCTSPGAYVATNLLPYDFDVNTGDKMNPIRTTSVGIFCEPDYLNQIVAFDFCQYIDLYPINSLPTTQDITINSRPSSIVGDYGIIGDNGSIIKVDGNMIVDESSSTVYNPVTNTTLNYTDYAYDYSDRSYNLTLEDGSTMKVTYGDENVTINEGDTVYNIYYIVPEADQEDDGSGAGGSGDTHSHDYTSEITKLPNCLLSGVRTFTCSCGDSYTKTVPATGHDWQISQQIANTFDPETGEPLTTGYTIYTCATCGEQYKSTDGNAPPNGSTGDDEEGGGLISGLLGAVGDVIGGLIEGLLLLATKALEALTGLGDLFAQMIETVLGFFGGFIDFLSAMFPFLPEETITILNLGLILMIAAAVFNRFFK